MNLAMYQFKKKIIIGTQYPMHLCIIMVARCLIDQHNFGFVDFKISNWNLECSFLFQVDDAPRQTNVLDFFLKSRLFYDIKTQSHGKADIKV